MVMTRFKYQVNYKQDGSHTTVTRLVDGSEKTFFRAGDNTPGAIDQFMDGLTDDLAESYFPKPRKEKKQK